MTTRLVIEQRFCGPPGCGNGGYVAGLMVQHSTQRLRVRLEQPIPLQTPLELNDADGASLELSAAGRILARAKPAVLALEIPRAVSYLEALEASRHFIEPIFPEKDG